MSSPGGRFPEPSREVVVTAVDAAAARSAGAQVPGNRVIVRNIVSRLGAKAAGYAFGFVGSVMLVRYLGVERLGQFQYASTFASLFGFLASTGLPTLLTREVARDRAAAGRLLGNVLVLQCGFSVLAFLVLTGSGTLLNPSRLAVPIALVGAGILVSTLGSPFLALLNAFEKMHVSSAIDVAGAVLRVLLIVVAIRLRLDLTGLLALLLVNFVVVFLLTKASSDRYCARAELAIDRGLLKRLLVSTVPFGLMTLFSAVYYRIDIVMLEKMQGDTAVGLYGAAYKLIDVLMITGASVTGALYPRMAAYAAGSPEALERLVERSCRYMAAVGVPLAVLVMTGAPALIELLFGPDFAGSAAVLRILVAATALTFVYMPLVHALNATGHEWQWIGVTVLNSVVNVGLNLVLIPAYGVHGAAVSTVVCELIALLLALALIRRLGPVRRLGSIAPVAVAALCMSVPAWSLADTHPIAGMALAAATYPVALVGAGFLDRQERLELRRLFAGR